MNAAMIVMENPLVEDLLQVPFAERNHEVQAVATDRTDQSLASGICLGRSGRRPQYAHAHGGNSFV